MTPEAYDCALAALRGLGCGVLCESDWPVAESQPPYRLAVLEIAGTPAEAIDRAAALTRLSVAADVALSLAAYDGHATWRLSAHRHLTAEEIAAALPRVVLGMAEVSP